MATVQIGSEKFTKLTCKQAQLMLRVIPLDQRDETINHEGKSAIVHYNRCEARCSDAWLEDILSQRISCREALEIIAEQPGPPAHFRPKTMRQWLAMEHVSGKDKLRREDKGYFREFKCHEDACARLDRYWANVPLSSHYDGDEEAARQIPFLLEVFVEKSWSLEVLLRVQAERVKKNSGEALVNVQKLQALLLKYYQTQESPR